MLCRQNKQQTNNNPTTTTPLVAMRVFLRRRHFWLTLTLVATVFLIAAQLNVFRIISSYQNVFQVPSSQQHPPGDLLLVNQDASPIIEIQSSLPAIDLTYEGSNAYLDVKNEHLMVYSKLHRTSLLKAEIEVTEPMKLLVFHFSSADFGNKDGVSTSELIGRSIQGLVSSLLIAVMTDRVLLIDSDADYV